MNETTSTTHPDGTATGATHYQILEQQPIEIMQRIMTDDAFLGFCHGNVIKYALRCGHKDDAIKEMEKVRQYADWYVRAARGETIDPMKKAQVKTIGPGCYLYAVPKAQETEKTAEAPSPDPEHRSWVELVKEFNKAYGVPTFYIAKSNAEYIDAVKEQIDLIREEITELITAYNKWLEWGGGNYAEILDAICDSIYVLIGLALKMGFNLDGAFREVHRSNMSKLDLDGKPIKRADGKVLKGPHYQPPNLKPFI